MAELIGNISCGLKVNLLMRTPILGFRMSIAKLLISIAAFVLNGKLEVEVKPELTCGTERADGSAIWEDTRQL